MAKVVRLPDLPVVSPENGDTVAAYRDGQVVRVPLESSSGGSVSSVGVSMPTGFQVANSPITSSGTITVSFAAGYGLPTATQMGQWSTAYGWGDHASAGYALASSLAAVATSGSYNDLTNKPTIPAAQVPADWNATTGVARILNKPILGTAASANTGDFATALQGTRADTAYGWGNHASAGYALSSSLGSAAGMDASAFATASQGGKADTAVQPGQLAAVATSGNYNDLSNRPTLGSAAAMDAGAFATAAQGSKADTALQPAAIGVTVQGYSSVLAGTTASFTTAEKSKLSGIAAGATANTGTVTSVQVSVPTGLSVSGGPITSSGTLAIGYASGYAIPTTAKQGQWDTAYGWGDHATAGYALSTSLATVATTGSYNDLTNKPTIPTLPSTVSQAEAEAGTATTVRGWTSQRVRQNVAAFTYSKQQIEDLISGGGQTPAEIKTLYESNPNTNAYTDAEKNKVSQVGTMAYRDATISTSDPSGGANGDVWFKV